MDSPLFLLDETLRQIHLYYLEGEILQYKGNEYILDGSTTDCKKE